MPIHELHRLVEQTAAAAVNAQEYLDRRSTEARNLVYAIPRVSVSATFGLASDEHSGIIRLIFGPGTQQRLTQEVHFSLEATPEPAAAARLADQLTGAATVIEQPAWMVPAGSRPRLAGILSEALRTRKCVVSTPDDAGPAGLEGEAGLVDSASGDGGLVWFRLQAAPERYLVVRLGQGRRKHDGIFLLEPDLPVPATVFDWVDSRQRLIWFLPFRQAVTVWTEWLAKALPSAPLDTDRIPGGAGPIRFEEVAGELWKNYVAARRAFAGSAEERPAYAIGNLSAQLRYCGEDSGLIAGRVGFEVGTRRGAKSVPAYLRARLMAPDFMLVQESLETFGGLLSRSADRIADAADAAYRASYRAAVSDPARRKAAWVGLAYSGDDPRDEFLVVHPARLGDEERMFAFTCRATKDGLEGIGLCLRLEDDTTVDRAGYGGFHNFFRAVRHWDRAGGWEVAP
jgi:hypothetical protein